MSDASRRGINPWLAFLAGVLTVIALVVVWRVLADGRDAARRIDLDVVPVAPDLPTPRLPDAPALPDAPVPTPR